MPGVEGAIVVFARPGIAGCFGWVDPPGGVLVPLRHGNQNLAKATMTSVREAMGCSGKLGSLSSTPQQHEAWNVCAKLSFQGKAELSWNKKRRRRTRATARS